MVGSAAAMPASGPDAAMSEAPAPQAWHTRRLAVVTIVVLVLFGAGSLCWARSGFATPPAIFMSGPVPMIALGLAVIAQTAAGLILALRRPDNPVGWVVLLFSVAISLAYCVDGYLALVAAGWTPIVDPAFVALLPGILSFAVGTFLAIWLAMIFPDGRLPAARYRRFLGTAAFGALIFTLGVAGTPGPLLAFPTYDNPLPTSGMAVWPSVAGLVIGPALLVLGASAAALALVDRYRRAGPVGRLQLRWYCASGVVLAVDFALYIAAILVLPTDSTVGEIIQTGFFLAMVLPPIAMVMAILRYRLYDIDVIIGRAVVYGGLTAILAGMYAASIRLFNALFVGLTGESSEAVLVITTLILATTFTPIKSRLERFVAGRMGDRGPSVAVTAVLDDPAFTAALDERIRVALVASTARSAAPDDVDAALSEPAEGAESPVSAPAEAAMRHDGAAG